MSLVTKKKILYPFLEGGGELGELTRAFDWSETSVGPIDQWPQSLRTIVSTMLHTNFPMFLWWGEDMIQFYNDGYRPSLGENGKHPRALGQPAKECWPEIWDIIYPLIENVRTKKQSFFLEDQLVPIFRNGKIEDVYWTFSYSPILDNEGSVDGVLVVCTETTRKVQVVNEIIEAKKSLEQSEANLVSVFMQAPSAMAVLEGPDHVFKLINEKYSQLIGVHRNIIGMPIRQALPEIAGAGFYELLDEVFKSGKPHRGSEVSVMLDTQGDGKLSEAYVDFVYQPFYGGSGQTQGIHVHAIDITEKVIARKRVEQSEANLRNIILQAPVAMCIFRGPDHVLEIGNSKIFELWGKTEEQLTNKPIFEGLPETRNQGFEKLLDEVYVTGKTFTAYGLPIRLPRGENTELMYVNFVYEPFRNEQGVVIGVIGLATDVTEQVTAAKRAEESEQRLRNIISEANVATGIYVGREMKAEYLNDAMLRIWGKDSSVIGKTIREALPELEGQGLYKLLDDVFTTGEMYWGKSDRVDLMIDGNLETGYYNFTYKPLRDTTGKIYAILNMAIDVTDQVLNTQRIEKSEANLKNLIIKAPLAMCLLIGPKHIIDTANDSIIELWGKPKELVMNKPVFEALPDAKGQGLEEILTTVYRTGKTFQAFERPVVLERSGKKETVFQDFTYEPYRGADGKVLGVLAITRDVTSQVQARQKIEEIVAERTEQLAISNAELKRSNAELAQFAYIASHDLQEPARKITTFIEMLAKSLGTINEKSQGYIAKIESSSTRMLSLIRDVLTFSQVSTSFKEFSELDLNDVLKNIKNDFELTIESKQAIIRNNGLPTIMAIPVQMNQLFSNLISNALKFMSPDKAPAITIDYRELNTQEVGRRFALNPQLEYWQIDFRDNGIGFNQNNAEQIFDIFQRLHGKTEFEGTGIGLAICKRIAQNHQGDIYADSIKGQGSVFHVILPKKQVHSPSSS